MSASHLEVSISDLKEEQVYFLMPPLSTTQTDLSEWSNKFDDLSLSHYSVNDPVDGSLSSIVRKGQVILSVQLHRGTGDLL